MEEYYYGVNKDKVHKKSIIMNLSFNNDAL